MEVDHRPCHLEWEPAQLGIRVLVGNGIGGVCGKQIVHVCMLVVGLAPGCRYGHDLDEHNRWLWPREWAQVAQAGLLLRLAQGNHPGIALVIVGVTTDMVPDAVALVPAQQHPFGGRVHDECGTSHMERGRAPPHVAVSI